MLVPFSPVGLFRFETVVSRIPIFPLFFPPLSFRERPLVFSPHTALLSPNFRRLPLFFKIETINNMRSGTLVPLFDDGNLIEVHPLSRYSAFTPPVFRRFSIPLINIFPLTADERRYRFFSPPHFFKNSTFPEFPRP